MRRDTGCGTRLLAKASKSRPKRKTPPQGLRRLAGRLARIVGAVLLAYAALLVIVPWSYRIPVLHPVSTLMVWQGVTGTDVTRDWVAIDDMADALAHSVLMSEDGQFCSHRGIDWAALSEVIDDALDGETPRGASTITMQAAKNLFLWPGRSYLRKAVEAPLAIYINYAIPKKRLMEIYLNVVEWGPGIFGAEAAAQHYFGRSAARLSPRQAALMAAALPNPIERNPAKPSNGMNRLARVIEGRARKAGGYVDCLK